MLLAFLSLLSPPPSAAPSVSLAAQPEATVVNVVSVETAAAATARSALMAVLIF